jgi:SnoaL-like domain
MSPGPVVGSLPPGRTADPAVQLLLDRAEIGDVIMRYAAAVDRRDWDLLEACFVPDVKVVGWGKREFADRQELVDFIKGVAHFHTTMHMMGNQFVEVDADRASLESYAMLTHHAVAADGAATRLNRSGGAYKEKLERRDGRWIITQRGSDPQWAPTGVTKVHSDDPTVRRLLSRAEIHDLMMSYALGIDERDYGRIGSCFATGFDAWYGDRHFTQLSPLLEFVRGVETFASTTHFLGQQLTELGDHESFTVTYSMITHRPKDAGEEAEWTVGGPTYRDRMVKEKDRWRIGKRGTVDWTPKRRPLAAPTADPAVGWLLDRAEITELVATSAFAVDTRDWELLARCLAPGFGACFEDGSSVDGSSLAARIKAGTPDDHQSCTFLGNQLIDLAGDRAVVETYAYITERDATGGPLSPWWEGPRRFVDEVVRNDEGWHIERRDIKTNRVKE